MSLSRAYISFIPRCLERKSLTTDGNKIDININHPQTPSLLPVIDFLSGACIVTASVACYMSLMLRGKPERKLQPETRPSRALLSIIAASRIQDKYLHGNTGVHQSPGKVQFIGGEVESGGRLE